MDFKRQNSINRTGWTPVNEFSLAETEHIGGMRTLVNRVNLQAPLMIFSKETLVFIVNGTILGPILQKSEESRFAKSTRRI